MAMDRQTATGFSLEAGQELKRTAMSRIRTNADLIYRLSHAVEFLDQATQQAIAINSVDTAHAVTAATQQAGPADSG